MLTRRAVLQAGIAASLLAGSLVSKALAESDPISSDWIIIDGTNNSAVNAVTEMVSKQSPLNYVRGFSRIAEKELA